MEQQRADLVAGRLCEACRAWATATSQRDEPLSFRVDVRGHEPQPSGEAENALPLVQFSVSTDLATNELVIQTSRQLADAVTQLARSFDTQSIRPGTSERLIAGVDDVVYVARKVQSPLNALRLQEQTQRLAARQLPGQTPTPAVAPK